MTIGIRNAYVAVLAVGLTSCGESGPPVTPSGRFKMLELNGKDATDSIVEIEAGNPVTVDAVVTWDARPKFADAAVEQRENLHRKGLPTEPDVLLVLGLYEPQARRQTAVTPVPGRWDASDVYVDGLLLQEEIALRGEFTTDADPGVYELNAFAVGLRGGVPTPRENGHASDPDLVGTTTVRVVERTKNTE